MINSLYQDEQARMELEKKRWNEQAAKNTEQFLDPPTNWHPFGGRKTILSKTIKNEKIYERLKEAA